MDDALRTLLSAAGRKGGLTGTKSTARARAARLGAYGATVDPATGLLVESDATALARRRLAADLRLARARKAYAAGKGGR